METKDSLLEIVNRYETTCATDSSTAMKDNFIAIFKRLNTSFFINTTRMMLSNMLYDWFYDFVILLFRRSVIWPSQVLKVGYNPRFCRLAFGIRKAQLHLSLY